jgi:heptosyltransferase-2
VLGYEHIVSLALAGGYADAVRSIEYAAMAGFFNPKAELDAELSAYFAGFQQIVSFLYDPDGFFSGNLRRCGVKNLLEVMPRIDPDGDHASRQLAQPLSSLALFLDGEPGVPLGLAPASVSFAAEFLRGPAPDRPLLAIHPGSGGERKNWPAERWEEIGRGLLGRTGADRPRLLLVGGEADTKTLRALEASWKQAASDETDVLVAENLPLPDVAALLAQARLFLGHDSGISHLAAAVGTSCLLLFGPTDPDVWSPPYPHVSVLRSDESQMSTLPVERVRSALDAALQAWE